MSVVVELSSFGKCQPSWPMSFNTSGVVNNVPYACPRCCMFLSIRISSIFSGSVTMSRVIFFDLGILFQSLKSRGTFICFKPNFWFVFI